MVLYFQLILTYKVVYQAGKLPFNKRMDISEIRRKNLKLIIEQHFAGVASELARLLDRQPSEISRVFSKNPQHRRNIGSRFAREIELALGKEVGWMDRQQTTVGGPKDSGNVAPGTQPGPETRRRIPVVSWVQAGAGEPSGPGCPAGEPEEWVIATAPVGERAYALRIVGDSMEPKFPEGGIIIVDPELKPRHGSFVIASLGDTGETTFKQLIIDGKRYLKPLNPRYPILEMNGSTTICGVVRQLVMSFD